MSHREALDCMRKHNIRRLPVVDGKRLVGIVSEKDLLTSAPSPATTLSIYEIYTLLDKLQLNKIMVHPVVTVGPDCPLADAARIMVQRKIGCLPVMHDKELVGIITETDILRTLSEVLGGGEQGIHFMVQLTDTPGALAKVCDAVARAGGNIVSVTTFAAHDGRGQVAIKERGADDQKLRQFLREANADVVEIQNGAPHEPTMVG